jgi:hypothetical protein
MVDNMVNIVKSHDNGIMINNNGHGYNNMIMAINNGTIIIDYGL